MHGQEGAYKPPVPIMTGKDHQSQTYCPEEPAKSGIEDMFQCTWVVIVPQEE